MNSQKLTGEIYHIDHNDRELWLDIGAIQHPIILTWESRQQKISNFMNEQSEGVGIILTAKVEITGVKWI